MREVRRGGSPSRTGRNGGRRPCRAPARGEVLRGAHDHAGLGHRRLGAVQGARDAEVHHLDRARVGDDDVGGLDVTVHDAVLVGVGERLQDTGDDDQRLLGAGRLGVEEEVADGAPLDDLHHDVRHGLAADVVLARVVHGHDGMVVEARHRLCLAREARLGDRVLGEVRTQQLDRHGAPQANVLGGEHLGHAAPPEPAGQPVPAVADQAAVAPVLRRFRHTATRCLGFGRALGALLLCHQSSPSFLPAVRAVLLRSPSATLQPSRGPPVRDRASGPDMRRTGHETLVPYSRANSVQRRYAGCNASATLLSRTVTERAPRLTCQCPGADLAGNSTFDHERACRCHRRPPPMGDAET